MNTHNHLRFPRTLNEAFGPYAGNTFHDAYNTLNTRSMTKTLTIALAAAEIIGVAMLAAHFI